MTVRVPAQRRPPLPLQLCGSDAWIVEARPGRVLEIKLDGWRAQLHTGPDRLDQGLDGRPLACTKTFPGGRALLLAADRLHLAGVVAKRPAANYVGRRSNAWLKLRHGACARDLQRLAP